MQSIETSPCSWQKLEGIVKVAKNWPVGKVNQMCYIKVYINQNKPWDLGPNFRDMLDQYCKFQDLSLCLLLSKELWKPICTLYWSFCGLAGFGPREGVYLTSSSLWFLEQKFCVIVFKFFISDKGYWSTCLTRALEKEKRREAEKDHRSQLIPRRPDYFPALVFIHLPEADIVALGTYATL